MLFLYIMICGFLLQMIFGHTALIRSARLHRIKWEQPHPVIDIFVFCGILPFSAFALCNYLETHSPLLYFLFSIFAFPIVVEARADSADASVMINLLLQEPEQGRALLQSLTGHIESNDMQSIVCTMISHQALTFIRYTAAPLVYYAIGGLPLALLYHGFLRILEDQKTVFSKAVLSFLEFFPSRLAAFCTEISSGLLQYDAGNGRRIYQRDRFRSDPPELGQVLTVLAGSMHLLLIGAQGVALGNVDRPAVRTDIRRAADIMAFAGWILLFLLCIVRLLFHLGKGFS